MTPSYCYMTINVPVKRQIVIEKSVKQEDKLLSHINVKSGGRILLFCRTIEGCEIF